MLIAKKATTTPAQMIKLRGALDQADDLFWDIYEKIEVQQEVNKDLIEALYKKIADLHNLLGVVGDVEKYKELYDEHNPKIPFALFVIEVNEGAWDDWIDSSWWAEGADSDEDIF